MEATGKRSRNKEIAYQWEQRELAQLRRKGRGRKTGFVLKPYLDGHTRIFGETNIFKTLAEDSK